jgi:membrane-anchored protein YejM (alkaline phosphatase superfamily)
MSSGNTTDSGYFGLFYGISPATWTAYCRARCADLRAESAGLSVRLFSSDGFNSPLYRQALLSDFSLPAAKTQSDAQTADQWINWLGAMRRKITAGSPGLRLTAPTCQTAISRILPAATVAPLPMLIRRSTVC